VEQRRLLIAVIVSLLIIVAYERFVLSRYRKLAPPRESAGRVAETPPAPAEKPSPPPSALAAPRGESGMVVVETDVLRVSITPVGARLADIELKGYRHSVAADSEPLDLVHEGPVLPGTLQLGADASDASFAYRPDRTELVLHEKDEGEVLFVADGSGGEHLEKRYRSRPTPIPSSWWPAFRTGRTVPASVSC
jgi:YidC/Oxa1 family membrane protein insertase